MRFRFLCALFILFLQPHLVVADFTLPDKIPRAAKHDLCNRLLKGDPRLVHPRTLSYVLAHLVDIPVIGTFREVSPGIPYDPISVLASAREQSILSSMNAKGAESFLIQSVSADFFSNFNHLKTITPPPTLAEAEQVSRVLGIQETELFRSAPAAQRLRWLQAVIREVVKAPPMVLYVLLKAGMHIELTLDAVTNHPDLNYLKGVIPRGWEEIWKTDSTWDDVPGISLSGFRGGPVFAANRLRQGHGCESLILHEIAHAFERSLTDWTGRPLLSNLPGFRTLHETQPWSRDGAYYARNYREEAFAISFDAYYNSETSRQELKREFPEMFRFIRYFFEEGGLQQYLRLKSDETHPLLIEGGLQRF